MNPLLMSLKENPFVLAPMAGITDCPFRSVMRGLGAGVVVTELVSATGLRFSSERTRRLMEFWEDQHPVGVQLFGEDLDDLAFAAREVQAMGADFVDLNFGCPVPKVVKRGAGSALLRDLEQFRRVIGTVRAAVQIPLTIKVRTGWDQESRNTDEVVQIAAEEGVTWVAVHGRTRAQGYSGEADWDYMAQVAQGSPVPVLGNGDIVDPIQAVDRLEQCGGHGVLIGRGCLKNPMIFREALGEWRRRQGQLSQVHSPLGYLELFHHMEKELQRFYDPRVTLIQLKKFAGWYSSGFPDSGSFRKQVFQKLDIQSTRTLIDKFFSSHQQSGRKDSLDGFLLGGHG